MRRHKAESQLYDTHQLIRDDLASIVLGEEPDHYRGFAAELKAELLGLPVYPVWEHLHIRGTDFYKPRSNGQSE